jgi:tRNA(Ile)-lysidine synthase TilS/MesJ
MKTKLDCLKLINFIEKSIDFKKIFYPAKNILIAYSGGQDSSALLAILYFK